MCWLTAARAWASRVAADRSCWYGAVCFSMFSGETARDSVTCVASGSSVSRTRDGSGTRTLKRARVRSSVKSSTPSSASRGRNSGSVAFGSSRRADCRRCHRASTRAGESVNPSRGSWQVAHERPFPPGKGRKKLMAPCTTRPLVRRDAASRPASVTSASICRSTAVSSVSSSSSRGATCLPCASTCPCDSAVPSTNRTAATRVYVDRRCMVVGLLPQEAHVSRAHDRG